MPWQALWEALRVLDETVMADRETTTACPYRHCPGDAAGGRCNRCHRASAPCGACGMHNRAGACFCRGCREALDLPGDAPWPMHGAGPARRFLGGRRFTGLGWANSHGWKAAAPGGSAAHPLALHAGILAADDPGQGFALFPHGAPNGPGSPEPLWRCNLGGSPTAGATPAALGQRLFVSMPAAGHTVDHAVIASIAIDTGEASFHRTATGIAAGETPLAVHGRKLGGAVAWALEDGLLVWRLEDAGVRKRPDIRHCAELHFEPLERGERVSSPVAAGSQLYAVTNRGRVLEIGWARTATAMKARGLRELGRAPAGWHCGRPAVLEAGDAAWLVFPAVETATRAVALAWMEVRAAAAPKLELCRLARPDGNAEYAPQGPTLLVPPLYATANAVFVPGATGSGLYRIPFGNGTPEAVWVPVQGAGHSLWAAHHACTPDQLVLATGEGLALVSGLYGNALTAAIDRNAAAQTAAAPLFSDGAMYVTVRDALMRVPLITEGGAR